MGNKTGVGWVRTDKFANKKPRASMRKDSKMICEAAAAAWTAGVTETLRDNEKRKYKCIILSSDCTCTIVFQSLTVLFNRDNK